jgi:hypothetical protein
MKKSIKSIGILVVILLACISLPLSMIAVSNNPTIINNYYYENYYGNNETEPIEPFKYPLEIITYSVVPLEYFFIRNFTLTEANTIIIRANWSGSNEPLFFLVVDTCMDLFYIDHYKYAYTYESGYDVYWNIPFEKNWYIIIYSGFYISGNITIGFEIV